MGRTSDRLRSENPGISVWAGGGVVVREGGDVPEFLLVYRPHRKDWTFPKGKVGPDEMLRSCALREVAEETGMNCQTVAYLDLVKYSSGRRGKKAVAYWLMRVESGEFQSNDEVSVVGWFDPVSARSLLTYKRDRDLLMQAFSLVESSTIRA